MTKVEDIKDTTKPQIAWHLGFEEGVRHMQKCIDKYKKYANPTIRAVNKEIEKINMRNFCKRNNASEVK